MRRSVFSACVALVVAAGTPSGSLAQSSIVDLSKPQTGKSRYVVNSDLTPADLGVVRKDEAITTAVPQSESTWCQDGCRMQSPQAAAQSAQTNAALAASSGRRAVVVAAGNKNADADSKGAVAPKIRIGRRR